MTKLNRYLHAGALYFFSFMGGTLVTYISTWFEIGALLLGLITFFFINLYFDPTHDSNES